MQLQNLCDRCKFSEMFWQILIRADISLQFSNKSLTILNFDFKLHGCARSTDVSGCPHAASNLWNRCRFSEMFWQILIRADISWQLSIKSFRTWNFDNLWFLKNSSFYKWMSVIMQWLLMKINEGVLIYSKKQ